MIVIDQQAGAIVRVLAAPPHAPLSEFANSGRCRGDGFGGDGHAGLLSESSRAAFASAAWRALAAGLSGRAVRSSGLAISASRSRGTAFGAASSPAVARNGRRHVQPLLSAASIVP